MLELPQPKNVRATKVVEPTPEEHDQDVQMLALPQPKSVGAAKLVEPTPEEGNQCDQPLKSREPEVPTGGQDKTGRGG